MVEGRSVLTLHRDYFRLRKPLERRIYELARKHCGAQEKWSISVETLQKKTGASSHLRAFRSMLRDLVAHDHLPDYAVEMNGDTEIGRAHVCTPATIAHHVCRLLLVKKNT